MLLIDAHLDLAMNALEWNRNLDLEVAEIRAAEADMEQKGRGNGTTTLAEMRRGEVFLSVVTVISRSAETVENQYGNKVLRRCKFAFAKPYNYCGKLFNFASFPRLRPENNKKRIRNISGVM